ncbi:MAG: hypothetical protein ACLQK4_10055 [Acidimicrobiales bacterium]
MSTPDPAANDRRRSSRQRKLGADAACSICGLPNLEALVLHRHHVGLEANDPSTVSVLCLNDHAIAQDRLRQVGLCEWGEITGPPMERQIAAHKGRADFLRLLAETEDEEAERLASFLVWLDEQRVPWRDWSEAER